MTNYQKIRAEIQEILCSYEYHPTVAVEIYGKLTYLNEASVRALSVMAKEKAQESKEAFKEFTDNVIVYSGKTKRKSAYKMTFKESGRFIEQFEPGFFDTCGRLWMQTLKAERDLYNS